MKKHELFIAVVATISLVAGCTTSWSAMSGDAPDTLRPPVGQVLVLGAYASGVQVYECNASRIKHEWVFKGPKATLADASGHKLGRHYAGPTWELDDGSKVVGEVRASAPSPDADAIPLLLLAARETSGNGRLSHVASIQRLATNGGKAPQKSCSRANEYEVVEVPYTATYSFFADGNQTAKTIN